MNTNQFKQRLLAMERDLTSRIGQEGPVAHEAADGPVGDAGDESVADERTEEQIGEAGGDRTLLTQVRAALGRISNGTFGLCVVDGGPIEEKRLEAVPWTPYCLKHQELLEGPPQPRTTM